MKGWRWALILVVAGLIAFLAAAEKPWDEDLLESIERREAEGKLWKTEQYATVYLWWAALGNLIVATGLLASAGWWGRPLAEAAGAPRGETFPRWFRAGLVLVVAVGAWERIPRLNHSFWNDEEYGFRTYIWGEGEADERDALAFEAVSWQDSLFRNKANNHLFYTFIARISQGAWEWFAPAGAAPFNEAVIRLVPFLAGLGSLVAVAWFLASCGSPVAGLAAALFLAFNPWHLRYSVEARGYSYVLFLGMLLLIVLGRALRSGEWKQWLAYGGCQTALVLSFPAELYLLAVLNALVFLSLYTEKAKGLRARLQQAGRFAVANILSAMVFIQLMAPSIPQMRAYISSETYPGSVGWPWMRELWAHLCLGIPWSISDTSLHFGTSILDQVKGSALVYPLISVVMPLLAFAGVLRVLAKRRRILTLGITAFLASGFLECLHNRIAERYVHVWYEVHMVMAFAMLLVLGVEALASIPPPKRLPGARIKAGAALQAAFLIVYALAGADARSRIRTHDRQPLRGVVEEVRGESPAWSPAGAATLTGSFGTSKGMIKSYDPWSRVLKTPDDLMKLMERADKSGKPLFVYLCGKEQAEKDDPQMLAIVEDAARFEKLPGRDAFKGLEELFSYHVYQYRGNR